MADDGEKTEQPTGRRLAQAREQGNIARSADLSAAALLISILYLLKWFGPGIVASLRSSLLLSLGEGGFGNPNGEIRSLVVSSLAGAGMAVAPLMAGVILVAVAVNVAQTGLIFSTKRLQPNLAALNPFKGIGQLFGKGKAFVQLGMNFLKMMMVAVVSYSAIHGRMEQIVFSQQLSFMQIFLLATQLIFQIMLRVAMLLLVLAIIDYLYQRFRINKSLKMSKQEVKEEMRSMDGDPKIKARRRQIQMQRTYQKIQKDVPTADVIVTNPTHYSIAIRYDKDANHAPIVVAKGQDYLALRIRQIAVANGIPILERPPLARALYKLVDVGKEIPEQFYATVAEILAYVYEVSGKLRQKQAV